MLARGVLSFGIRHVSAVTARLGAIRLTEQAAPLIGRGGFPAATVAGRHWRGPKAASCLGQARFGTIARYRARAAIPFNTGFV